MCKELCAKGIDEVDLLLILSISSGNAVYCHAQFVPALGTNNTLSYV